MKTYGVVVGGAVAVIVVIGGSIAALHHGSGGKGRLHGTAFAGEIKWTQLSQVGQPKSFIALEICSDYAPVHITSIHPLRTVGSVTLDRSGLSAPFAPSLKSPPSPPVSDGLPEAWNQHQAVVRCGQRQILAVQETRHGPSTGAVVGLTIDYLDEKSGTHAVKVSNLTMVLCGSVKVSQLGC